MSEPLALIIEDEDDMAEIFTQALQATGFRTETIRRGDTARERLAEIVPDLVVLDLHLPHVDGGDLLKQIRADGRLCSTQVIVTSADPLMAEAVGGQAELVLIKPISFSQLRDLATRLRPTAA
jgi:DNA-binding response OmpR family regulator